MRTFKLSRNVVLLALLFIIVLNVAMRYPTTPHEIGDDGFMNQALAKYITQEGYASWHTSVFSFFGLGSFTYPAGYQFVLSEVSQLTGFSLEVSVFVISTLVGVFGALFAFIMTREIFQDDFTALLGAFIFSTAPLFLRITNWNASARQLLLMYIPLLVFLLLRTDLVKKAEKKNFIGKEVYMALTLILLLTMGMIHRLAIYLFLVIVAFMFSMILFKMKRAYTIRKGVLTFRKHDIAMMTFLMLWGLMITGFIYMQLSNFGPYAGMNLWYKYQSGFLFSGSDIRTIFINMAIDYATSFGILSAFGVLGAIYMFQKREKNYGFTFVVLSMLILSPLYTIGLYTQILVFTFFFVIMVVGIAGLLNNKKIRKIAMPMLVIIIISSVGFSGFMIGHWQSSVGGNYMTESEFNAALYAHEYINDNETFVTNNQVFGNRVIGVADAQFLTEDFAYPLIYGWVDKEEAKREFDLDKMIEEKSIIVVSNLEKEILHNARAIILSDIDETFALQRYYTVKYSIENTKALSSYTAEESIHSKRYCLYSNGIQSIWKL